MQPPTALRPRPNERFQNKEVDTLVVLYPSVHQDHFAIPAFFKPAIK